MKLLISGTKTLAALLAAGLLAGSVQAQMPGPAGAGGMNAALTKLFGEVKAFSAKADVRVLNTNQQQNVTMPLDFALLNENVRVEVDMEQMKNSQMPPGAAAQLKQMGMARVISIIRPEKKLIYVVYPEAKVLMTMPMNQADAASAFKPADVKKTELGKETIDGHPCVKYKNLITQDAGRTVEATTWNATDLKDFPVQIETEDQGNTSFIHFKDLQFAKPDAKLFDPPAGYTEYKDPQELMQGVMKKMMENSQKK